MKSLEEIKSDLTLLMPILRKRFKVGTIDIFGSYARKQASEKSDIDLLVTYSTTDYDYFTIIGLKNYLRQKLHMKVNIVSKEFLNKHIRDEVLKEAIPV